LAWSLDYVESRRHVREYDYKKKMCKITQVLFDVAAECSGKNKVE
jgi:hypothetical protein